MGSRIAAYLDTLFGAGWIVPDFGIIHAVAILLGAWLAIREAERRGFDAGRVFRIGMITVAAALVGSRLFIVVQYADWFIEHPLDVFAWWKWGTASSGAYIGGMAGALIACRWQRFPAARFLDLAAPSVLLAIGLGRIGCFLNGCCYGTLCNHPWGVRFPEGSGAHEAHLAEGLIDAGGLSLAVHPTQLYEALYAFLLFGIIIAYRHRRRREGELIALTFLLYPIGRFLNEFLRADERGSVGIVSFPQALALAAMIASAIFLLKSAPPAEEITVSTDTNI
jgi:phosphatidylglycerol:prolipoprotein diacylglycerol transferase